MEPGYSNGASLSSEAIYTTDKETPRKQEEMFAGATHCDDAFVDKGEIGKLIKKGLV
jgi:kinesin family protein 22